MLKKTIFHLALFAGSSMMLQAKPAPEFELDQEWKNLVAERAPKQAAAVPKRPRKVLVFSLATGFVHWCIPHSEAVIAILGAKSGAYETVTSEEVEIFRPERLREFDAVVLNNNCPDQGKRDMFHDVLVGKINKFGEKYQDMPLNEREELAKMLYQSLVQYVADGGGLVLLHGAITNFNQSDEFSELVGGSFDYHPPQQEVILQPVQPDHPILKPFGEKPFVHYDEPYVMKGAYHHFDFAPMLEMETSSLKLSNDKERDEIAKIPRYVAWIKPYKKGRVFYSSPSHNAQSFERPELLGFLLNGMQYALGDLDCEDRPIDR